MIKIAAFTVSGQPFPKERPRFGRGRGYTTTKTEAAEQRVKDAFVSGIGIRHTIERPVTGSLRVRVRFFRDDRRRVDLDNLAKVPLDALNKLAWADDSQIVSLVASKHLDVDRPRSEVEIWTVGEDWS